MDSPLLSTYTSFSQSRHRSPLRVVIDLLVQRRHGKILKRSWDPKTGIATLRQAWALSFERQPGHKTAVHLHIVQKGGKREEEEDEEEEEEEDEDA